VNASATNRLSLEGKSLKNKLTVIVSLIFGLPFSIIFFILYREGLLSKFDESTTITFALLLFIVLAGVIILRQIFDKFITIAALIKKAGAGESVMMETYHDTSEFLELSVSFNRILEGLEETSKQLEEQAYELKKETLLRKKSEDALKENEERYQRLVDTLNDYIKAKISEPNKPIKNG